MKWLKKVAATPLTTIARVVDNLNAQTNDRTNAPSIHAVREAVNNNWLSIYPVGSIYMSVNNVNPSTVFGGTWEQIKDRFLLASGDTYNNGQTGGSATHTPSGTVGAHSLTTNEIPAHTHGYNTASATTDNHTLTVDEMPWHTHGYDHVAFNSESAGAMGLVSLTGGGINDTFLHQKTGGSILTTATGSNGAHNHGITQTAATSGSTGSGAGHDHGFTGTSGNYMPPYLAVNVWVRTA